MIILVHQLYHLATSAFGWKHVNTDTIDVRIVTVIVKKTFENLLEMGNDLNLAATNNYAVIIVKPCSRDSDKLAEFHKDGVTADMIRETLGAFEDVIPLYYGWFFNEQDPKLLYELVRKLMDKINIDSPAGVSENEEQLKTIKTEIEEAKVEERNIVDKIGILKDELTRLTAELSENEEHLKTIKTEIKEADVEQRNLVKHIGISSDELSRLTGSIIEKRSELTKQQDQPRVLKETLKDNKIEYETTLQQTETSLKGTDDICDGKMEECERLTKELDNTTEKCRRVTEDLQETRVECQKLSSKLEDATEQGRGFIEKVNNLESTCNTLREEIADFERLKSEYEDRLKEQAAELEHKNGDLITKQQAVDDLDDKYYNLLRKLDGITEDEHVKDTARRELERQTRHKDMSIGKQVLKYEYETTCVCKDILDLIAGL